MGRIDNKIAIVTGGGSGIGKATVERFVSEGAAKVIALDIDEEALQRVASALNVNKEPVVIPKRCNVTNSSEVKEVIESVFYEYGDVDYLVNVVGGSKHTSKHFLENPEEVWDDIIEYNLKSCYLSCYSFLKEKMNKKTDGAIVNVSSQAARYAVPTSKANYASAKAGILGLTRQLAYEFGSNGIRVNAVCPGWVLTSERVKAWWEERGPEGVKTAALKRPSLPEEQAGPILFLCSDDASYITGATLDVSGGLTIL